MTNSKIRSEAEKQSPPSVRKKRGALLVHEGLRDEILWMRIAPGAALDEVALAKRFEVSRTPIREALLLLANEGFVHFLQNRTTIVAPLSLHNQAAFLDTFILLSRSLVRSAAMNGTVEPAPLSAFVDSYEEALRADESETAFRAQLGFYRHIAALADNQFLEKYFLEAQDASVRMKLLYFFPYLTISDKAEAISRLNAVAKGVIDGKPDAGDDAVRESIRFEIQIIQRGLEPRFGHEMKLDGGTELERSPV